VLPILADFSLSQSVVGATQDFGHTLDTVIHRPSDNLVLSSVVSQELTSDHSVVLTQLNVEVPRLIPAMVDVRNIRGIVIADFLSDLQTALDLRKPLTADSFDKVLRSTLDVHAPLSQKTVSGKRDAPWYNMTGEDLLIAKRERRRAERALDKNKLTVFKQIYNAAKRAVTNIVHSAKVLYYSARVEECQSSKQLFGVTNNLLGNKKKSPLPTIYPIVELPQRFLNFFQNKIVMIREKLDAASLLPSDETSKPFQGRCLEKFLTIDEETVKQMILQFGAKSCGLDPLPSQLLFESINVLLPHITRFLNDSIASGKFPDSMKQAIVKPLIKKSSLDRNDLKNYRPVSNLSVLSKVLEKIVLQQLNEHLSFNKLMQSHQSAYRSGHSTETALLKIMNDILISLDKRNVSLLTLLDLSAAFDTIDHAILLKRLEMSFGIRGIALSWFESYLSNRSQNVVVNGLKSESSKLQFGVPQGSVLGPVLFLLYMSPLFDIVKLHNIGHHAFADDNQLYKDSSVSNIHASLHSMEHCVSAVKAWMTSNKLQLNDSKTEAMLLRSPYCSFDENSLPDCVQVGECEVNFVTSVTNLGVTFDHFADLSKHVQNICQISYNSIREISAIRNYLTVNATKTLMCSLVLSRLDYCNSLLHGCEKSTFKNSNVSKILLPN
jgi:retron-type reverse transcriptase